MREVLVSGRTGEPISLSLQEVDSLRSQLAGEVLLPEDRGYDQARTVWNAMVDQRPGLIICCLTTDDVATAVKFAGSNDLLVSVRSGGHNIAGKSVATGSFTIDLSRMKGVEVDLENRSASCQPGLKLGELDEATQGVGLATVLGVATDTGMAGVAIGGGYGWLAGRYGMTCDNLTSAELVLADGELVAASADENEDLFWAIRGGGGNFGIVTSFRYRLHSVRTVWGGLVMHPLAHAPEFLKFFREYAAAAPDDLTTVAALLHTPEGDPVVAAAVCYCGPMNQAESVLKPLRAFGSPLADSIQLSSYLQQQKLLDDAWPPGDHYYWKTNLLSNLSDEAIEVLTEYAGKAPNSLSVIALQQLHGEATRVPPDATAFPHRYDHYNFIPMARWKTSAEAEKNIEWARALWLAMQPYADEAVYGNDLGDGEGDQRVGAAFGINYDRLVRLKNRYDPLNLFSLNQNIKPTA